MTTSWRIKCWKLGLVSALAVGGTLAQGGDLAKAQIIPDPTLGAESSVVTSLDALGFPVDRIDGGATRGANLFHSFEQFSVLIGRGAYFNNALEIQNIIYRVTGSSISSIDGLIAANGTANLFLINPNGIIFGPNATLAIGGSFVGSTASSVNFADGISFSATDPQAPPLLTVNVLLGLQFGGGMGSPLGIGGTAGSITNQSRALNIIGGVGLQVLPTKTLSLVGGNVSLNGGLLQALGGRVELGGLAGTGTVGINGDGSLSFPDGVTRADVSLTNGAVVNVAAEGGGSIAVNTQNLNISGGILFAGIREGSRAVDSRAGNIEINTTDQVRIAGEAGVLSGILNTVGANFQTGSTTTLGSAGDIVINTGSLEGIGSFVIGSATGGQGNAGNVTIRARDSVSLSSGVGGGVSSIVSPTGLGNGSDISIETRSLSLSDVAQLATSTQGQGNAGNIRVNATEFVSVSGGSALQATSTGQGNAGSVTIEGRDGAVPVVSFDGAIGSTSISSLPEMVSTGKGGDIKITARSLFLTNSAELSTETVGQNLGQDAGNISVHVSDSLAVSGGSFLQSDTFGQGDAGDVTIEAIDAPVSFEGVGSNGVSSGVFSSVRTDPQQGLVGTGNSGTITIKAGSLALSNGAQLRNSLDPGVIGKGSDITITARSLELSNGAQVVSNTAGQAGETGAADAGNISMNIADSLTVSGGSFLQSDTFGQGDAGDVTIEAENATVSFKGVGSNDVSSGVFSSVGRDRTNPQLELIGKGKGGEITIRARSLSITDGAQLQASTRGQGDAGSVTINARDLVSFDGVGSNELPSAVFSTVESTAVGNGGGIDITTGTLSLTNGAQLNSSTFSEGDAGNISVRVDDAVSLTNESQIRGVVEPGGEGKGADIDIEARSLSLTNGSQVSAILFRQVGDIPGGQGRGGEIRVNASDSVTLSGIGSTGFSSGLLALTEREALGSAGNITVTTSNFRVADGAVVAASTFNFGDAGNITINTKTFEAVNGGQVLTNTRNSGNAGSIRLNATDRITLSGSDPNFAARLAQIEQRLQFSGATDQVSDVVGNEGPASGLFANTAPGSTGDGGSIFIDPIQLTITDGAGIAVDSQGTGNGGSLQVQAGSLTLDRDAFLSATTASGEGGDITLQVQDLLLMRRNSNISTQADDTGNGGNIDIDADFIVALPSEDSNIIADATEGRGGNIDITASGIFGIQPQEQQTPLSDITASSEVGIDGTVEINRPDVDPSQGLVTLLAELVDASNQIATGCAADAESIAKNEFIITGRGGLPPNPSEPLSSEAVLTNWATLEPEVENRSRAEETAPSSTKESVPNQIAEAQGWVIGANGEVVLTATAPSVTPHIPEMNPPKCHGF